MTTFLINGMPDGAVSPADRGLAYGDGLFETLRISKGRPVFLAAHLNRMQAGCERLGIDFNTDAFRPDLAKLLPGGDAPDAVLKLVVTRGAGGRGYRPGPDSSPTRIASLHPMPSTRDTPGKVFVCSQRLASQPAFAGIKHLNRLEQVAASMEWPDDHCIEGMMLDYADHPIEGTRSNLFIVRNGEVSTPDLSACGINGVLRQHLIGNLGQGVAVTRLDMETLLNADELFFCNSVLGIMPVASLLYGAETWRYTSHTVAGQARDIFHTALQTC
jgi:4-amino-4-deoxychorismate lyase